MQMLQIALLLVGFESVPSQFSKPCCILNRNHTPEEKRGGRSRKVGWKVEVGLAEGGRKGRGRAEAGEEEERGNVG